MCGITGFYSKNLQSSDILLKMNKAIMHRGEDDEGYIFGEINLLENYAGNNSLEVIRNKNKILERGILGSFGLGFRRLSILDLSEKAHQPFTSEKGNIITFNGEIYNFKILKNLLLEKGKTFYSDSDTEVVLLAYEEFGIDFIKKLDGMFAFCIYDVEESKLIFARDRIGIKPLFYSLNEEVFTWSSEIKAIIESGFIVPKVNWEGVKENFLYQASVAPNTCFEGINALEPAHFMIFDLQNFTLEKSKYWELPTIKNEFISKETAIIEIKKILTKSIENQLYADVPVTSMMSGGIDSTLITTLAKEINKDINCFTINYLNAEQEIENAKLVADKFGIKHTVKNVEISEILNNLKEDIQHFEEPYSSIEVLLNAAKYAKSQDIKVVLSGNGADEIFGGYGHLLKLKRWKMIQKFRFLDYFIPRLNINFIKKIKNQFQLKTIEDFYNQGLPGMKLREIEELFQLKNQPILRKSEMSDDFYQDYFRLEMAKSLSVHHVFRDDLSAMKYGVEFRYPFLCNDLVDYVAQLPENLRYNGRENKPLLRRLAETILPREILRMPKKGFSFPVVNWYKKDEDFKKFVNDHIEKLIARNLFNNKLIEYWKDNILNDDDFFKIWHLVTFEIWLETYIERQ